MNKLINRDTIETDIWNVLYNCLKVINPLSTTNIHSSYNSVLIEKQGYPQVIINPPGVSFEKETVTGNYTRSEISVNISLYTISSETLKSLKGEVTSSLLKGRTYLSGEGMKNMNIGEGDYGNWSEANKRVHRYEFSVTFRFIVDES